MKDHVEIGHLIKFDAFSLNIDQPMNLEIRFKIHTSLILTQRPPKSYKPLKFYDFRDTL